MDSEPLGAWPRHLHFNNLPGHSPTHWSLRTPGHDQHTPTLPNPHLTVYTKYREMAGKLHALKMNGPTGRTQRIFRAVKTHWMTVKWWICVIIHLSKSTKCVTQRMISNVDHGLGVIMCQWFNCGTTSVAGEAEGWGQGCMETLLSAQFCCGPKNCCKI